MARYTSGDHCGRTIYRLPVLATLLIELEVDEKCSQDSLDGGRILTG
jgi:hypothetical protein